MIHFENAPLIVGVTGHMDLREEELEPLKKRVRTLIRFLKGGDRAARKQHLDALLELLRKPGETAKWDRAYQVGLGNWPDLRDTPIVVLSSLAPGADTLVAEVALEDEFQLLGFTVLGALPFPRDVYRNASTFVRNRDAPDAADQQRQLDYDRLLKRMVSQRHVQSDPAFAVLLAEDEPLSLEEREKQFLIDRDGEDPKNRRRRYQAAGEYMAAYAHLLIAVWDPLDDHDTSEGTAAIVEARRNGMTPGLLPTTSNLTLPHGGPVLHVYTHRQNNPQPDAFAECAPLRWRHPYDSAPDSARIDAQENRSDDQPGMRECHNLDDDDPNWQRTALALFCRIAQNIAEFNQINRTSQKDIDYELKKRLTYSEATEIEKARATESKLEEQYFSDELQQLSPPMHAGLGELAALRRRASDENSKLSGLAKRTLRMLFVAAMLGAFLLHLFAHWHPQSHGHADQHHEPHWQLELIRVALGTAALAAAICALLLFWRRRPQHNGEQARDYRALAEGLRVQFYWNLVGLGHSVSANYMQRQRGELDWIRGAIRATSFPYHRWRDWFDQLAPLDKVKAIRCTLHGWVIEQQDYFHDKAHERHEDLHFWHTLGGLLALAGLGCVAALGIESASGHKPVIDCTNVAASWIVSAALVCVWLLQFVCRHVWRRLNLDIARQGVSEHKGSARKPTKGERAYKRCKRLLTCAVPTFDRQERAGISPWKARLIMAFNFLMYLPLSSLIASLGLSLCVVLAELTEHLPDAFNLGIVLAGSLLVGGALAVAWAEKNLYSELAYQYHTMESLFACTRLQLERDVERLQHVATDPEKTAEFQETLRIIQDRLFALGKEALDENAEWLILHRARPLEPVMAG